LVVSEKNSKIQDARLINELSESYCIISLHNSFQEGSKYSEFQSKILSESQRISEWKIKKEFELKQKDHELSVSEREINHLQQKIKEYQEHAAKLQSRLAEEKENHEELVAK